jgi:hypothetical protein
VRAFLDNGANVTLCGRRPQPLAESVAGFPDDRVLALTGTWPSRPLRRVSWPTPCSVSAPSMWS